MIKNFLRKLAPNPLDRLLKKAQAKKQTNLLLFWNRGLGDIPLGLYAICHRIRHFIPHANITFLTRPNLVEGFQLLKGVEILVAPKLKRGENVEVEDLLREIEVDPSQYDLIIEDPNPTQWVSWQKGKLIPLLHWNEEWDRLHEKFRLDPNGYYVGAHVQTETDYAHWRNWPLASWEALFKRITSEGKQVILFGYEQNPLFEIPGVIDLRGKTTLFELLSLVKHHCKALIVPDSGVSSMVYFLKARFPIRHISLWADPHMGILKQNVPSPNPLLRHIPLLGKNKNIGSITVDEVYETLKNS